MPFIRHQLRTAVIGIRTSDSPCRGISLIGEPRPYNVVGDAEKGL